MKNILITNDDGYLGEGLFPLVEALIPLGNVFVVVPDRDCSALSHAITLDRPILVKRYKRTFNSFQKYIMEKIKGRFFTVSGTPADCVRLGYTAVVKSKIDLVAAGINKGPNLGIDTIYSATVACAREASIAGIPSVAISQICDKNKMNLSKAQIISYKICKGILENALPKGVYLNVNIPAKVNFTKSRITVAAIGNREYGRNFIKRIINNAAFHYTLLGEVKNTSNGKGSDVETVKKGDISLTPITLNGKKLKSIKNSLIWLKKIQFSF
ncbi:MAG: 5'/3'-nucleotidase SurE [bacterium]